MRNATSIGLFGTALALTLLGACGGGGDGTRDGASGATNTSGSGSLAGSATSAGTGTGVGGSATTTAGSGSGGASGGSAACNPMPGPKAGDGMNTVIDELDDTNTMFAPAGTGAGSWDWGKDTAGMGTIMPANTAALAPVTGGHMGSALHVTGTGLTGWGASLAAFLNGPTGSFDASSYGGVAFYIKGTTTVQEGMNKLMIQARMPDVLPGPGSCCDDKVIGMECYSGHRVVIDVPADWTEVRIAWADFKGPSYGLGMTLMFNPNRIRDINFSFNHDAMAPTTTSALDVWVDSLRFMKKDEMGNVGTGTSGGSGGTASGGSGGSGGAAAGGGGSGGTGGTGGASAGTGGTN